MEMSVHEHTEKNERKRKNGIMEDMNNTLNSIFVRLDVNLQNLTSKAIAQIIVKILYSNEGSMTKAQIKEALAQVNGCAHLSDKEIDELLDELSKREIRNRNGLYYLSTTKRTKLQESVEKSIARKNSIIDRFFNRMNSSLVCKHYTTGVITS